jgi:hypothetical protein
VLVVQPPITHHSLKGKEKLISSPYAIHYTTLINFVNKKRGNDAFNTIPPESSREEGLPL